jgi:hypothetical protein
MYHRAATAVVIIVEASGRCLPREKNGSAFHDDAGAGIEDA